MVDNKSRTLITDKAKYRNKTEREAVVFDGKDCYNNNNNKNECHSNIIVDKLQGCSHSKKLRESESESRSSKVV